MRHTITWHGHANFQIESRGVSLIIDPFFEGNPKAAADPAAIESLDIILVTHDHHDHIGQTVAMALRTGARVAAVVETAAKLIEQGVPTEQILNHGMGFNIGGTVESHGVAITMTQAAHTSATGVPVGYIITLPDGFVLYHAGDTGLFSELGLYGQLYSVDLAMLPIGGVFTMDPRQAALGCQMLGCKRVIPMHWATFPVLEQSTDHFEQALRDYAPDCAMLPCEPGVPLVLEGDPDSCGC